MDTSEAAVANKSSSKAKPLMNFHFGNKSQKAFSSRSKKSNPLESMSVDMLENLPDL